MSNRIVPSTYRSIIDDVMSNIRNDFAEFGVDEDVLAELQHKWEQKVVESNVAEFEPAAAPPVVPPQQLHPPPPTPAQMQASLSVPQQRAQSTYAAGAPSSAPHPHYAVKPEPVESPFVLPTLPGPGPPPGIQAPHLMLPRMAVPPGYSMQQFQAMQMAMMQHQQQQAAAHQQQQQQQIIKQQNAPTPAPTRLPQVDGPSFLPLLAEPSQSKKKSKSIPQLDGPSSASDSSSEHSSDSPPPEPRPNVATGQATVAAVNRTSSAAVNPDEEINSDLDDDESDGDDDEAAAANTADGAGAGDIVYCTYDKVQRVKNKWKCTLKDGIISVNGKDYLFSKCAGEFEW